MTDIPLPTRIEAFLIGLQDDSVPISSLEEMFGAEVYHALVELQQAYDGRGVMLHVQDDRVGFRTRSSANAMIARLQIGLDRLPSNAVLETIAIVALYGPVTRSEIEAVRGVRLSTGVLEKAIELEVVAPGPRRETPGRPMTWTVTDRFFDLFSIDRVRMQTFDLDRRSDPERQDDLSA